MPTLLQRLAPVLFLLAAMLAGPAAAAAQDPRIEVLSQAHDWKATVATGNLYLKQQSLVAARSLLARIGRERDLGPGWKRGNVYYDAAEAAIVAPLLERVRGDWTSLGWMAPEWNEMARTSFSDAEVDTLVTHFRSDVGRKQAKIIDHQVQFHLAGALTMSGKLQQDVPGAEDAQKALTYAWDEEDREARFSIAGTENAEGQRFALSPLGAKYQRVLIIKVTGILGARLDRVAAALANQARELGDLADPFVTNFRAAGGR